MFWNTKRLASYCAVAMIASAALFVTLLAFRQIYPEASPFSTSFYAFGNGLVAFMGGAHLLGKPTEGTRAASMLMLGFGTLVFMATVLATLFLFAPVPVVSKTAMILLFAGTMASGLLPHFFELFAPARWRVAAKA